MTKEERQELAITNFKNGYNCSQAVALAFIDLVNISKEDLLKISSPFGGGMVRAREVCGAISGGLMILGLLFGYDNDDYDKKAKLYTIGQEYMKAFKQEFKTLKCYELLDKEEGFDSPLPSKRSINFYQTRPCANIIGKAAYILDEIINKYN